MISRCFSSDEFATGDVLIVALMYNLAASKVAIRYPIVKFP
jgi:hypothetical protein